MAGGEVGEGVAVQGLVEGQFGLAKDAFEQAVTVEAAGVGRGVKTLDEGVVGFGLAEHLTDANGVGGGTEGDAAAAPAASFQMAQPRELVDDFDQVMAGDLISLSHIGDGEGVALGRGVHEHAEGIIAEKAESHGVQSGGEVKDA